MCNISPTFLGLPLTVEITAAPFAQMLQMCVIVASWILMQVSLSIVLKRVFFFPLTVTLINLWYDLTVLDW